MELRVGASGRKLARRQNRGKKRICVEFERVNRYQRCSDPERSVIRLSGVLTGDLERVTSRRVFLRQF